MKRHPALATGTVRITHEPTGTKVSIQSDGGGHALVMSLFTPPENRGRGGARAVMLKVEQFLDLHGMRARVCCRQELLPFYARHGFTERPYTFHYATEVTRLPNTRS